MLIATNALRIVAIASVVVCGVFETALFSWVPIAAIVLATILGVASNRGDPDRLNDVAEQAYFIGYLSTIAAFAAAVINIYLQGHIPEKPTTLLLMAAIALMTTVAGLLFMTAIKEYAAKLPRPAATTPDLTEFLQALKTLAQAAELATATRSLAEFIETKDKLLRNLDGAANDANSVKTALSSLSTQIIDANASFAQVSVSAAASRREVGEVNEVLDRFVTSLAQRIDGNSAANGARG
jgi:hypothetical protein